MKIAQVSPLYLPVPPLDYGGTERVVSYLTESLVALGHDVTLYASSESSTRATLRPIAPCAVDQLEGTPGSYLQAIEAIMLEQVARHAHEFDIIHFHTEFFHLPVFRNTDTKTLTTLHWRQDQKDRQTLYRHFGDMPLASISNHQAHPLVDMHSNIQTVYHGVPEDIYTLNTHPTGYLAFLGRMSDQKRPDRAIEIARACNMPLKLAGGIDVGNPTYFDTTVRPYLGETIEHIPAVTDRQKNAFLGNAAALLFPIDWPEPFGLVMIEAMACGTPVIAWHNGSVAEVVEDGVTGFIVSSIKEAIAAVGKLHTLDRAAIRKVFEQKYTARIMAQNYVAYYKELTGD